MKHEEEKTGRTTEETSADPSADPSNDTGLSRRGFLKGAVVAGVSVTVTGVVAKKVVDAALDVSPTDRYMQGERAAETALTGRSYFEVSPKEKKGLVDFFVKSYRKNYKG